MAEVSEVLLVRFYKVSTKDVQNWLFRDGKFVQI